MEKKRILFSVQMVGHGHQWQAGKEYDIPAKEAERIVAAGFAEYVEKPAEKPAEKPEPVEDTKKKPK